MMKNRLIGHAMTEFDGYTVNKNGDVYSIHSCKFLKYVVKKNGYHMVCVRLNKKQKSVYVHRLVAKVFLSNPENKPHVNHKDGDKGNNRAENLEWCTVKENFHHLKQVTRTHRYGIRHHNAKLTDNDIKNIFLWNKDGFSRKEIANAYGISRPTLCRILQKKSWVHVHA